MIPLIQAQWMKANTKFSPPVTTQEHGIFLKLERYWNRVDYVAKGKGNQAERKKILDLLDRLFDITTCAHVILLSDEQDSDCKAVSSESPHQVRLPT